MKYNTKLRNVSEGGGGEEGVGKPTCQPFDLIQVCLKQSRKAGKKWF